MRSLLVWAELAVKQMLRTRLYLVLAVVQPLFFLLVLAWLSDARDRELGEAVAGTTVMGMWSAILFGAGRALQRERRSGTMELWLVSPRPLLAPLFGVCLGAATLGLVSAASALGTATAFFGYRPGTTEVALFALTLVIGVPALAVLGLLLSGTFVLLRQAAVLSNMLEYPVWFACALVVPADSRPRVVAGLGEVLSPTHLGALLRSALTAGRLDAAPTAKLLGFSALYLVLAVSFLRHVGEVARRRGDLAIV